MPLADFAPTVDKNAWIAPSATLIGEVDVSGKASVWYGAVVRGEKGKKEKINRGRDEGKMYILVGERGKYI